ncbi:unnamed protein product [Leptosia nina]|uniref:Uncharacterized protein n=1 Tax=Leptosia nina TaxID=320188 RepID=A0AAV1J3B1_9NEOP
MEAGVGKLDITHIILNLPREVILKQERQSKRSLNLCNWQSVRNSCSLYMDVMYLYDGSQSGLALRVPSVGNHSIQCVPVDVCVDFPTPPVIYLPAVPKFVYTALPSCQTLHRGHTHMETCARTRRREGCAKGGGGDCIKFLSFL